MPMGTYILGKFELLVHAYPNVVWGVMGASTVFEVPLKYFCGAFEVKYLDNGANNCTKEEAIVVLGMSMYPRVLIEAL